MSTYFLHIMEINKRRIHIIVSYLLLIGVFAIWHVYRTSTIEDVSYSKGFDKGKKEGVYEGKKQGYDIGYKKGYMEGCNNGFRDGILESALVKPPSLDNYPDQNMQQVPIPKTRTRCGFCNGRGFNQCWQCKGEGCFNCDNTGVEVCTTCEGQGYVEG